MIDFNKFRFLYRIQLWPHFIRLVRKKISNSIYNDSNSDDIFFSNKYFSEYILKEKSLDLDEVLKKMDKSFSLKNFQSEFKYEINDAQIKVDECPYELGGPTSLALTFYVTEYLKAERVVETGVAYGWSTLSILFSLRNRPESRLYSVDLPYVHLNNDNWVGCAVPSELRKQWSLLRCADRDGLPKIFSNLGKIDLAHYDSDKSFGGRLFSYRLIWRHLRDGGALISDDIGDNLAFLYFCTLVKKEPIIIKENKKFLGLVFK